MEEGHLQLLLLSLLLGYLPFQIEYVSYKPLLRPQIIFEFFQLMTRQRRVIAVGLQR